MDKVEQLWVSVMSEVPAWSVVVEGRGISLAIRGEDAYSGASTIKTFVLEQASLAVAGGALDWSQPVVVTDEHVADGDGALGAWPMPNTLSLFALCHLMTALSDNTATNAVVDTLGGLTILNDALADAGLRTRMRAWVSGRHRDGRDPAWQTTPSLPSRAGLSVVVPLEHAAAINRLTIDPQHATARGMLAAQIHRANLARHLRDDVAIAHKGGSVGGVRHDGGVLFFDTPDPLSVHVFTDGPPREETVDDPACIATGRALALTLQHLGLDDALVPDWDRGN